MLALLALGAALLSGGCSARKRLPDNPAPGVVPREAFVHYLRYGERLEDVARRYQRRPQDIVAANHLKPYAMVYEGYPLRIPPIGSGGEAAATAAASNRPALPPGAWSSAPPVTRLPPADFVVPLAEPPEGETGAESSAADRLVVAHAGKRAIPPAATAAAAATAAGFRWPVAGVIEHEFSSDERDLRHGLDIAAPRGSPVQAAREGTVLAVYERFEGYGPMAIIKHAGGYSTVYANIEQCRVKEGQAVAAGQTIASVGPGGGALTIPYLHFQVRLNAQAVDPAKLLPRI